MRYTNLFFDLDDTLYPSSSGLWSAIRDRMGKYMFERMGIPRTRVPALRKKYFETYGTTLKGLQHHHQVDVDDFLAFVHDLPLEQYLHPLPELQIILNSLPQKRWIFTNADIDHAKRVLDVLGLESCFEEIIDIRRLEFNCKPDIMAYRRALEIAGGTNPVESIMFDDSPLNLAGARQAGLMTVLVNHATPDENLADVTIPSIVTLPEKMPELWKVD